MKKRSLSSLVPLVSLVALTGTACGSSSDPAGGVSSAGNGQAGGAVVANNAGSSAAGLGPSADGGSSPAAGGSSGTSSGQAGSLSSAGTGAAGSAATTAHFSFFVTSLAALRRESGSQNGFGGNLGGLSGADAICTRIAETALPGSGQKGWRAFLSTSKANAIERVGTGPWYDRNDKLVASDVAGLLQERPAGMTTVNDLPNEDGVPNRAGTGTGSDDNHDTVTGSNLEGKWDGGSTCNDYTSATGTGGPRVGHSWPEFSGKSWIQAHTAPGCAPSVSLVQTGAGSGDGIGNAGGYGGFYCLALKP